MRRSSAVTSASPTLNIPSYSASRGVPSSLPRANSSFWIFRNASWLVRQAAMRGVSLVTRWPPRAAVPPGAPVRLETGVMLIVLAHPPSVLLLVVKPRPRAVRATASGPPFVHDGFSDILYVLLPV